VLNWSRRTGAFSAEIAVDQGSRKQRVHVAGSAQEMVEVAQLARAYARDEIVSKDDVVVERIPRRMANLRFVVTPEKIIGLAARRNLRARVPLTATDFTPPMMVQRGEMVTIVYEAPGLTLTARGKALEAGAENDMINVLNSQSNRIVRARITAHGKVAVTSNRARALKVSEVVQ